MAVASNRRSLPPVPPTGRLPVRYNPRWTTDRKPGHQMPSGCKEPAMPILRRTHTCGDLRDGHVGQTVTLNGWVNTIRAYPQQVFIDLRDRYGLTQVVVDTDAKDQFVLAQELGREFCLAINGTVRARLPGKTNPGMATGAVEVRAT